MNLPPLDRRLALIADMVRPGRLVADVGTDHGKLMAHLVGVGKAPGGCATDIHPGPLSKAEALVKELGLEGRVKTILCDGLAGVEEHMADDIVIAGMGGELIARILEAWPHSRQPDKHFLLQPMTKAEHLRGFLYRNGYHIEEERCVRQSGKVYSVMSAYHTGRQTEPGETALYLGGIRDFEQPDAAAYARRLLLRLKTKADGMEQAGQDASRWKALMEAIVQRTGQSLLKED